MPGATPVFSIPYPLIGETIDPTIFASFSTIVSNLVSINQGQVTEALTGRGQLLADALAFQSVANGVETSITWRSPNIDNDVMFSAGSPTQFTIQVAGVWFWSLMQIRLSSGFGSLTSLRGGIFNNGIMIFAERAADQVTLSPETSTSGLVVCNVGDVITARLLYTGSAGPANYATPKIAASYVCPLA